MSGLIEQILVPVVPGLAESAVLVVITSGLTLTFGTMRILNLAHGAFFMFAAFLCYTLSRSIGLGFGGFVIAIIATTAATALLGLVAETTIYQRFYRADSLASLLGTFALFNVIAAGITQIWGSSPLAVPIPALLKGSVSLGGVRILKYDLFVIAVGAIIMVAMYLWLRTSVAGLQVRAIAADRDMASVIGINSRRIFSMMFVIGCALAALGGSLVSPLVSLTSGLGSTYIVLAFAVVLIGGLGSLGGAVVASLILGLLDSFTAVYLPAVAGYSLFLGMVVVLFIRPYGIWGAKSAVIHL